MSKYIENKFFINSLELSDVKLTELLNLFLENDKVSVIDLFRIKKISYWWKFLKYNKKIKLVMILLRL